MADPKFTKAFGNSLRRMIEIKGWSQAEMARRLGVAPTMVNRWITGEHAPNLTTVFRVLEILDVEFQDLFPLPEKPDLSRIPTDIAEQLVLFDEADYEILRTTIRGIVAGKELLASQKAKDQRKTKV